MNRNTDIKPKIQDALFRKAGLAHMPLQGTFELTPCCTMDCRMCYIRMTREEADRLGKEHSAKDWIQLAQQAREAGMLYLLLTGGEPLLHREFRRIYEELCRMGFIVSINSNATLIDETFIQWFRKLPPNRINVTLYGGSNETYEKLCRFPGGFDRVTKAILLMKDAGINIKLNATISNLNVQDYDKIIEFSQMHELPLDLVTYLYPPTRRADEHSDIHRLPPEEAARIYLEAQRARRGDNFFLRNAEAFFVKLKKETEQAKHGEKSRSMSCRGGRSTFWVTWDGKMGGCPVFGGTDCNPFRQGFAAAWEETQRQRTEFLYPVKCAGCEKRFFCISCPAAHFAETGKCETVGEYLCEYADCYIQEMDRIMGEIQRSEKVKNRENIRSSEG